MTVPVIISSMGDWNVNAIGFESRTFVNKHELFRAIFKTHMKQISSAGVFILLNRPTINPSEHQTQFGGRLTNPTFFR